METAWTSAPSYGFRPFVRNLLIKLDKICQPTRCHSCDQRFDDLTDTIFAGHHQPLKVWILSAIPGEVLSV